MKLVMIHHWDSQTPDCLPRVARAIACKFWTCRSQTWLKKTDSWKRKMSTFINFWLENVGISPMNSQQPFHGNPCFHGLEVEPFVPGSVTRTMQFVMLVPRHSTMSVVAGKRWVMGVVKQHPMVRGSTWELRIWWLGPDFCCHRVLKHFSTTYIFGIAQQNIATSSKVAQKIIKVQFICTLGVGENDHVFLPGFNWSWDVTQSQCIG